MPLVTSKEMFKKAYEGGYAIGAFNVNNMEIIQGITEAAKEEKAPLILQVSAGARKYAKHVYHQYVIRSNDRDSLKAFLGSHNISTAIHYPQPVHVQPAYRSRIPQLQLFQTELIAPEILSLPMYPNLTDVQASRVCDSIIDWNRHSLGHKEDK